MTYVIDVGGHKACYATLEQAKEVASRIYDCTGIVVGIEQGDVPWAPRLFGKGYGVARPIPDQPGLYEFYWKQGNKRASRFRTREAAAKLAATLNQHKGGERNAATK